MQIQTRTPFNTNGDVLTPGAVEGLVGQHVKITQNRNWNKPLLGTAEVLAAEMDGPDLLLTLEVRENPDMPGDIREALSGAPAGTYSVGPVPVGLGFTVGKSEVDAAGVRHMHEARLLDCARLSYNPSGSQYDAAAAVLAQNLATE
jgi:hypothetical protein